MEHVKIREQLWLSDNVKMFLFYM